MDTGNYYKLMAEYNRWMNRNIYHVCSDIPDALRKKDLGAFFRSIHSTLNHILYADLSWFGRFIGKNLTSGTLGKDLYDSFDQLKEKRFAIDDEIVTWAGGLTPKRLEESLTFTSSIDGKTRTLSFWVAVTQMFNHQTHHRGQVTTLMKQLGFDPGITDIPWLLDLAAEENPNRNGA